MIWGARFANAFMSDAVERFVNNSGTDKKVAIDMRLFDKIERAGDLLIH
jgi:hypothetical protein